MPDFVTNGSGPALVCLHGIGSSSRSFAGQLDGLSNVASVTAWDAPGYRSSPAWDHARGMDGYAEAVLDLLDALEIERADILGTSFGGVIAVVLAVTHPERVRSLVLADSTSGSGTSADKATAMRGRGDELARTGAEAFARARARRLVAPGADEAQVHQVAATMVDAIGLPGYDHAARAMADTDLRDTFARVSAPTLVLVGEHDQVTPPELSRSIAAAIPDARFALVPDAGHVSNVEQPDAFNDLVRDFLDEVHGRVTTSIPTTITRKE